MKRKSKKTLLGLLVLASLYVVFIREARVPLDIPVKVRPMRPWERAGDVLMVPFMYIVSGTFKETPQRTHAWNVQSFSSQQEEIPSGFLLHVPGKENVSERFVVGVPVFHIPILGGWKDYVVLQPKEAKTEWFAGWITEKGEIQISKIPLSGRVRLLRGPGETAFFGVDKDTGKFIHLECIGSGRIGDGGEHSRDLLL